MTPKEYAQLLQDACKEAADSATEMGHDLHPWSFVEYYERRTACRGCGARVTVRVRADDAITTGNAHISACPF